MRSTEFDLLRALAPLLDHDSDRVPVGVGDDAAVVRIDGAPVAVAVDALVDGVHFDLTLSSYADVGFKAMAVNVSDLAAVGAEPQAAVVVLQRPAALDDDDVLELYRGLREAAERWGVAIVGGDTVGAPVLSISVTVLGRMLGAPLRRGGARVGDRVVVVGELGLAAAALALHRAGDTALLDRFPELRAAHRRPLARPEAGGALVAAAASAAIDVSDGLGRDLGHVAAMSGVAIVIRAEDLTVPPAVAAAAEALGVDPLELVVTGGDDYALAACVDDSGLDTLAAALGAVGAHPHPIGYVEAGAGVRLVTDDGTSRAVHDLGWQHR